MQLGLLRISGEGAKKFLQGQLTCDMETITSATPQLAAHCNPQGRIISLFQIYQENQAYYLKMPQSLLTIAKAALHKYAVFFKVSLEEINDTTTQPDWQLENIKNNIPSIYPETSEKFLPHELNLPALDAVSFTKGCYTGQEIIARMQYRGKLKTHLYQATVHSPTPPLRGADIYNQEKSVGSIVDYCELGYNNYQLLITAQEADAENGTLFIDTEHTTQLTMD